MNMFQKALDEAVVAPKAAKSKKPSKPEINVEGIAVFATVDAVIKGLTGIKSSLDGEIKAEIVENAVATRSAESITGIGNDEDGEAIASANLQLRKRVATSALSETEVAMLAANGVSTQEVGVDSQIIINPKYKNNEKLLTKISKALEKVAGMPEDFIVATPESKKTVTTENSIKDALAVEDKEVVAQLLAIVATPAIKATLNDPDLAKALDRLKDLI